jgi:hypothetical protein
VDEISQRLRKLIMDVLELVADEAGQREYQAKVPYVSVPAELFNQWDDVFPPKGERFRSAFNDEEMKALLEFDHVVREVSDKTPRMLPPLDEFIASDEWRQLSEAARSALRVFQRE